MRRGLTNILVMFAVVTSLAAAPQSSSPGNSSPKRTASSTRQVKNQKPVKPRTYQVGRASWYGKFFHGKPTASGEPYNMFLFTAAHNTLPLGTLLRVTNVKNGRSVVVRVNDRGPVPEGRIIDLSYAAAQILRFREGGIARVRLQILDTSEVAQARGATRAAGLP